MKVCLFLREPFNASEWGKWVETNEFYIASFSYQGEKYQTYAAKSFTKMALEGRVIVQKKAMHNKDVRIFQKELFNIATGMKLFAFDPMHAEEWWNAIKPLRQKHTAAYLEGVCFASGIDEMNYLMDINGELSIAPFGFDFDGNVEIGKRCPDETLKMIAVYPIQSLITTINMEKRKLEGGFFCEGSCIFRKTKEQLEIELIQILTLKGETFLQELKRKANETRK